MVYAANFLLEANCHLTSYGPSWDGLEPYRAWMNVIQCFPNKHKAIQELDAVLKEHLKLSRDEPRVYQVVDE